MFSQQLLKEAEILLAECRANELMLSSAESCTGGLIAALFTEIAGSSDVFERGFITYSNLAKIELLGVSSELIREQGAVSHQTAIAMAEGALTNSRADIAVSVTGIAGPGGGSLDKPVGLVHLAVARKNMPTISKMYKFGDIGRSNVRQSTVLSALQLLKASI